MSRKVLLVFSVSVLVLFCVRNFASAQVIETLDFDGLSSGAVFSDQMSIDVSGVSIDVSSTLVYTSPIDPNGDPNTHIVISDEALAGRTGNELHVLNVMLGFDFASTVDSISFYYHTTHQNLNVFVNNELVKFGIFDQIDQAMIGGSTVEVIPDGTDSGVVTLTGNIYTFAVGGEDLRIDDVSFGPVQITYHVAVLGDDSNTGITKSSAFATIQKGIDTARDGERVLVHPGVYTENISFNGKSVTVRNATDPPVLQAPGGIAVRFITGEDSGSVFRNFIIRNSDIAVQFITTSPTVRNVTVVNNEFGFTAYAGASPNISNCIFWNNTDGDIEGCELEFSCTQELEQGVGNISIDPLFVLESHWELNILSDPNDDVWVEGDYHLQSAGWRYRKKVVQGSHWTCDPVTSRCIDGGPPRFALEDELMEVDRPDSSLWGINKRINMGAYGGTYQASMSPEGHVLFSDISNDGIINNTEFKYVSNGWGLCDPNHPGNLDLDGVIDINDLSVLTGQWQHTTSWYGHVNMINYMQISVGTIWESLDRGVENFTIDFVESFYRNSTEVFRAANTYDNGAGNIEESRYYFYCDDWLYSTADANDLDALDTFPVVTDQFTKELPRSVFTGNQIDLSFYGPVYVMKGSLSEVLDYSTELSLEDFPDGDMPDVVAYIADYGRSGQQIVGIFGRNAGPLLMGTAYTQSLVINR